MKYILGCFVIITTCASFKMRPTENPDLSLSAVIVGIESKNISLRITLTNNTADSLKYVGWSCSWQNSYLIDNNKWRIKGNICYTNGHETFKIPPHQSESKVLKLEMLGASSISQRSKFKIGFLYTRPEDELIISSRPVNFKANDSIIWSNEMTTAILKRAVN